MESGPGTALAWHLQSLICPAPLLGPFVFFTDTIFQTPDVFSSPVFAPSPDFLNSPSNEGNLDIKYEVQK